MAQKKKLIEVALPLEAINAESAREKSIRKGHPSTLHLWWARRPLATARAVIWASLVDDPSSHPELFPDEDTQRRERERLFGILMRLVTWENSNDESILDEAKHEILKSTGGNPPALLDPFSGGGAIPLEGLRLGLEVHAHDLNPVAVMINKAMVEVPPKFSGQSPVNPKWHHQIGRSAKTKGLHGLADDVRYYGEWMRKQAYERIGDLYPKIKGRSGKLQTVIAWIWARVIKCPNPACGCEMPLIRSFVLSKKKGHETYVKPVFHDGSFEYRVEHGKIDEEGTVNRKGAKCLHCGAPVDFPYIRNEGRAGRMALRLIAIVTEGDKGREYISANSEHIHAANVELPAGFPDASLPFNPRNFQTPNYGLETFASLFTPRQLTALVTFSGLVKEAQKEVEKDAIAAGLVNDGISLRDGGIGAKAYGEAVGIYLSFAIDRLANRSSTICIWNRIGEKIEQTFGRQAIPMTWDFAEANVFSNSTGSWSGSLGWIPDCIDEFPEANIIGTAIQHDAQTDCGLRNFLISTDPPYYNNIVYADLADFFYIWMREGLKDTFPELFSTMLVPKKEELVATPYRFDGDSNKAKAFFEDGMYRSCCQLFKYAIDDIPVTIYYAFKQSDTDEDQQTASTGWETMLSAILKAGFAITGTWPVRTERATGLKVDMNALASSIVLVCRKRPADARSVTRREFINALHREMRQALEKLQSANIAPVDLAQSAIGPGIGVFSRYKSVLEADGKPMSVRAALQIINQELDAFYNEQEGELDRESRFCVDLFNQYAFNTIKFGDADILARAKNTSVQALADRGVLQASKGQVRLLTREEIPERVSATEECVWLLTQQLARAMEKGGVKECASIVMNLYGSNAENAKALAYRLYTICERKNWAQEGYAYNNLVVAWPDIQAMAADMAAATPIQLSLEDVLNNTQQ